MEKKLSKEEVHDQINANQLAGMSLEKAIYQAGYSHGIEFEQKRQQSIGLGSINQPTPQAAVWVKGEYERLYDQLKDEPERKIVCWVNYEWVYRDDEIKEVLRDICAIRGKTMEFISRGHCYGGGETWRESEDHKKYFLDECASLNVEWLDESPAQGREDITEEDLSFLDQCNLAPHADKSLKVVTELDEGSLLSREDILKLADILRRYSI